MTELIPYILLAICYFIFSSLFERYITAYKEIELITGQILIITLLFCAIEFAKEQEKTSLLAALLIMFFIEKIRRLAWLGMIKNENINN